MPPQPSGPSRPRPGRCCASRPAAAAPCRSLAGSAAGAERGSCAFSARRRDHLAFRPEDDGRLRRSRRRRDLPARARRRGPAARLPLLPPPIGVPQATPSIRQGRRRRKPARHRTRRPLHRARGLPRPARREPARTRTGPLRGAAASSGCRDARPAQLRSGGVALRGGRLTMTSRRGHEVTLISERDGQWRRDPEVGATLICTGRRAACRRQVATGSRQRSLAHRSRLGIASSPTDHRHGFHRHAPRHSPTADPSAAGDAAARFNGAMHPARIVTATQFGSGRPLAAELVLDMGADDLVEARLGLEAERRARASASKLRGQPATILMIAGSGSRRMQRHRLVAGDAPQRLDLLADRARRRPAW